jgi:hypothetical protein
MSKLIAAMAMIAGILVSGAPQPAPAAPAVQTTPHTVTFVNRTGATIWVGSTVNADGTVNLTGLPTLADGQQATVTIPETTTPGYWRGKFFARQQCTGSPGSTFHCAVGDCGTAVDRCTVNGEQPASLAEFNFDPADPWGAPWYNVSYVNAVSVPITIDTVNGVPPWPGSAACSTAGCPEPLLDACPADVLQRDATGHPMLCVNPSRDAPSAYSDAVTARCPRAYAWSKQDTVPGNQVVYNCASCSGFTVTFHSN